MGGQGDRETAGGTGGSDFYEKNRAEAIWSAENVSPPALSVYAGKCGFLCGGQWGNLHH